MRNCLIWYTGLLIAFAQPTQAQPDSTSLTTPVDSVRFRNHRYNEFFRGNRDLSYIAPKGELGAPDTYILNGELIANFFLLATPKSRISVAVMQRFWARVRTEQSAPVRTPSFRLGAHVYYRLSASTNRYKYVETQLYHHSNGQDGPVFLPNGSYNTATGDFSTNYLQLTYNWGTHQPHRHGTFFNVGYRWHAPFFNHSEGLLGQYGFSRVMGQALYRIFCRTDSDQPIPSSSTTERLRVSLQASYALNTLEGWTLAAVRRRLNAELTLWYIPPFSRDAGVFTTVGYYGEDPYNIYFNDRYAFVRLGIAAGFTRYTNEVRKK
ncbi:hypothetical protein AWR27_05175 [Spirosoma montaniterrae]|uniref:Phosphatidylcholine 1-acylhydrolase n=2 Tax=Spirosoma montaniterrae TaxID=1178516 RepID=A0A1P9WTV6_9BACT|nr:hypothetical protein AWR27_05175 [Spirosoma montaniterrae]